MERRALAYRQGLQVDVITAARLTRAGSMRITVVCIGPKAMDLSAQDHCLAVSPYTHAAAHQEWRYRLAGVAKNRRPDKRAARELTQKPSEIVSWP